MTSIVINHEKERVHIPITQAARYPLEIDLLRRGRIPTPVRGVKVNDLSPLWPASHFREGAMKMAKQFVSDLSKRGYDLNQHEGDIELFGPYRHQQSWNTGLRGAGWSEPEMLGCGLADFVLRARFIKHQGYQHIEDHERMVETFGDREWSAAMKRAGNDVTKAMTLVNQEVAQSRNARRIALDLVEQRERREDLYGRSWLDW